MDIKRIYEIINNKEKVEIEYESKPVWIQNIESTEKVRVGFIETFEENVVNIKDLVEKKNNSGALNIS